MSNKKKIEELELKLKHVEEELAYAKAIDPWLEVADKYLDFFAAAVTEDVQGVTHLREPLAQALKAFSEDQKAGNK